MENCNYHDLSRFNAIIDAVRKSWNHRFPYIAFNDWIEIRPSNYLGEDLVNSIGKLRTESVTALFIPITCIGEFGAGCTTKYKWPIHGW